MTKIHDRVYLVCSFEIKFYDYQFFVSNYVIPHLKHVLSWDKLKQILQLQSSSLAKIF